jgi:glucose-1-phosphate cytidylyltransferase
MKTVILCGGQGTRLREETEYKPKPLVEVGGKPILWHIMKLYAHFGHTDFICCLGYKANLIKDYFLNYQAMNNDFTICLGERAKVCYHGLHEEQDFRVTLADTGIDSMTGGRVRRIKRYVTDEEFMVTYGDGLSNVNIDHLLAFHRSHGRLATCTTFRPVSRYGLVNIGDGNLIDSFTEKPTLDGWVNSGFFVFNRRVFEYLDGDSAILEREPLERLAAKGELMAYRHDGFFYAMDTYRDYLALNEMWDRDQAPWKIWDRFPIAA